MLKLIRQINKKRQKSLQILYNDIINCDYLNFTNLIIMN